MNLNIIDELLGLPPTNPINDARVFAAGITLENEHAVLFWPRKEGSKTYGPCQLWRTVDGKRDSLIRDFRDQYEPVVLALAELLEVELERK